MGKGRLTISAEMLEQMMLLPEGMSLVAVRAAGLDGVGTRDVEFIAEHPDIGEEDDGGGYPDIDIRHATEYVDCGRLVQVSIPRLDKWRVAGKYPRCAGPWITPEK